MSDQPDTCGGDVSSRKSEVAVENPEVIACPVVAIGASAGGLEALKRFLKHLPANSGMIFVVIQHFLPDRPSMTHELLSGYTGMPVHQVTENCRAHSDNVYVISPNTDMSIVDCELRVSSPSNAGGIRRPVDEFFRSLAIDQGENAVAVILSGAGADGAVGLQMVKKHGGLTIVQHPEECRHDGMPRAAMATGMVDHVLSVDEMPARLISFFNFRAEILKSEGPCGQAGDILGNLGKICAVLSEKLGHDFNRYKQSTLVRRIQRRLQLLRIKKVSDYMQILRSDPAETECLFKDLLISVTQFFRDPEVWETLSIRIIPKLISNCLREHRHLRVWAPGCSTGQEAYTIAILLKEYMTRVGVEATVKVFATDIDEEALDVARQARYSEEIVDQVSSERLMRYFARDNGGYQVVKEIREMCIFSAHNLIADPPFSRMDLVSCRNVLIYFDATLQQKVIPIFHYALRSGGFLTLGPAESLGPHQEVFKAVDKRLRLFQAKETPPRLAVRIPRADGGRSHRIVVDPAVKLRAARERNARETHERAMLDFFAPPSVLIDANGQVLHYIRNTARYLEPPVGAPSHNLFDQLRKDLRVLLRAALHEAKATGEGVVRENVEVEAGNEVQRVTLVIKPLPDPDGEPEQYVVVFREEGAPRPRENESGGASASLGLNAEAMEQLEHELRSTQECLQCTIEELENSNEELKSSNEELISINEEFQAANDSLQASKEELQSLNEELETVNAELSKKVDELDRTNVDMQNLFGSTRIATIFLDRQMRIKRFTPDSRELFRLIDSDLGRPLGDLAAGFPLEPLLTEIRKVNGGAGSSEMEISSDQGKRYLVRILPYRTSELLMEGVVITFVNITELKNTEEQLRQLASENRRLQDVGMILASEFDLQTLVQKVTDAATELTKAEFGAFSSNCVNEKGDSYLLHALSGTPPELFKTMSMAEQMAIFGPAFAGTGPIRSNDIAKDAGRGKGALFRGLLREHEHLPVASYLAVPVISRSGEVIGGLFFGHSQPDVFDERAEKIATVIAAQAAVGIDNARMVKALRATARDLEDSERRWRQLADSMPQIVWAARPDGHADYYNARWYEFTGFSKHLSGDESWKPILHPDDVDPTAATWARSVATGEPYRMEYRFFDRKTLGYRWFSGRALPVRNERGEIVRWYGTCTDIDDYHRAAEALKEASARKDEFLAMLGHELRNPLAPVQHGLSILDLPDTPPEVRTSTREMMLRQIRHLSRLVDDLLDVSRISRGKILLQKEPLDFMQLVCRAVQDSRLAVEEKGLRLDATLPATPIWINGDATRLSQAVGNLLNNAAKFTDPGGIIRVGVERHDEQVRVSVEDTGIGMSEATLAHLFEPFSQADTSLARSQGGLGLGLAMVKGFAELHGGRAEAYSPGLGLGSKFVIELPICEQSPSATVGERPVHTGGPYRFVLVEDNKDAAMTMAYLLRRRGHEVIATHTGEDGLVAVRNAKADVLVCDIGLPGELDGYEVARNLAQDPMRPHLMLALSGYGQESDQRLAKEAGFDAHLTKPVEISELLAIVSGRIPRG